MCRVNSQNGINFSTPNPKNDVDFPSFFSFDTAVCCRALRFLTFSPLMTYIYIYIYIYIYMSYRTANLQKLHFIYLFNKYTY